MLCSSKSSAAYCDKFLSDTLPTHQPYPGAWRVIVPQEYPLGLPYKYYFCSTPAVSKENFVVLKSEWPEKLNPFTQENLLDNEEEELQELILRLKTSLSIPYRESLVNSLFTLFRDAREEDPTSLGVALGSLRHFFSFLQSNTKLKCPKVSLTPEYNIYSTWREAENHVFSVYFLPNGDVRFVIFKPDDRHPERRIRIFGTATTDVLLTTVAPHGILDWISE